MLNEMMNFSDASDEYIATALLAAISPKMALLASNMRVIEPADIEAEPETRTAVVSFKDGDNVICCEMPVEAPELRCGAIESTKTNPREVWVPCPVCEGKGKHIVQLADGFHRLVECGECGGKRGWFDDMSSIDAYFTTSGDNPVLMDQPTKLSTELPRNFYELAPRKHFYSQAKFDPRYSGMRPTNEEGAVLKALLHSDDIQEEGKRRVYLRAVWKRFWDRHFAFAETANWFVSPKAIRKITAEFKKRGIVSMREMMENK